MSRLSPLHDSLQSLNGVWQTLNGMPTLMTVDEPSTVMLGMADVSFLARFGVKGANAAQWLASQGIAVPDRPNTWNLLPDGGMIARLGLTEFLIEDSLHTVAAQLIHANQQLPEKVYPVLRQDAAIVLCGSAVNELLRQTCSVNFSTLPLVDRPVVLTSIIGVAVTIIPAERDGQPFYRIWCDGTFGAYVWKTLLAIVKELGGGAIGVEQAMGSKTGMIE